MRAEKPRIRRPKEGLACRNQRALSPLLQVSHREHGACDDRKMGRRWVGVGLVIFGVALVMVACDAQTLPPTAGETLGGHKVVVAEAVRGQAAVLIAGFSKDAGDASSAWAKAVHGDAALKSAAVYQLVMLERAPGFVRPMIKSGMRRGMSAAEQEECVILTADEQQWRSYFGVNDDKEPWVVMMDAGGRVVWHGHGAAAGLEPLLRRGLK